MSQRHKILKGRELDKKVQSLSSWQTNRKGTQLYKSFKQHSFVNGLAFVAKITVHAEVMAHHPDIELSYGTVKVKLSTHEVKGLTKADFELAKKIDSIRLP
jgi:4a-hydroxytetrahydrobiopterin dehydratase